MLCGCEDFIRAGVLHSSLNNWRLGHTERLHTKVLSSSGRRSQLVFVDRHKNYVKEVFPKNEHIHTRASYAATSTR
eukprot:7112290-Ditylum_brightwellii.AAC.1